MPPWGSPWLVFAVAVAWARAQVQDLPPSPCPAFYSYETDATGKTVGLIRLLTPPRYDKVHLVVRLSMPAPLHNHEVGELTLRGGRPAAIEATNAVVAGRRHLLQYNVRFPQGKPVPTLVGFTVNGHDICTSPPNPNMNRLTSLTLNSFLNTGVADAPRVDGWQFTKASDVGGGSGGGGVPPAKPVRPHRPRPEYPTPETTPPPDAGPWPETQTTTRRPRPPSKPTATPDSDSEEEENEQLLMCGRKLGRTGSAADYTVLNAWWKVDPTTCGTSLQHNALVVFGSEAAKGQWPWQTAIFRNNESASSSVTLHFQCGGTLVSRRHVITAAHCVVMVKERRKVQHIANSDLLISLGKYNIRNWAEPDQQLKEVDKIITHPEFNIEILRNDLAIIQMSTSATITAFVRPICLWDRSADLSLLEGEVGTVGGWGRDETGSLSDKLRIATMPIVSQETCLRSDNSFYVKYTSESTFCAGFRNGTTVCNGDSGGGLHLRMENPHQSGRRTWYLRGVVSLSMLELGEQTCDTHNFVVFTDVAKYKTWIDSMLNVKSF